MANVSFYANKEGHMFGALVLTEDVLTGLPVDPRNTYKCDGKVVDEWKLMLFSITKDSPLGDLEYYEALKRLEKHIVGEMNGFIIVKPLTLVEQEEILNV